MASACSSSVSIQKSSTASNRTNYSSNRRTSCDTLCSSNSSCFLQKKKPINPLARSVRSFTTRSEQNAVRQRVMSAKLIKMRNLQSQLNDANFHLMELAKENRALKTLQRRQDKALNNYEGINADLPRLMKSHEEENRTLSEKNRTLKKAVKDLAEQLKIKDEELNIMRDQLKHLTNLSKDKHLEEREKLRELLEESREEAKRYEAEINLLNRKLILEMKNSKQKLNAEMSNHKRCQRELSQALSEMNKLSGINNDKQLPKRRFPITATRTRQSLSMISLNNNEISPDVQTDDQGSKEDLQSEIPSEIKLEPINKRVIGSGDSFKSSTTMQSPAEKIKARLSANKNRTGGGILEITDILEKLNTEEENIRKSLNGSRVKPRATKLETLSNKRIEEPFTDVNASIEEKLDECNSKMSEAITNSNALIEKTNETFERAESETDKFINDANEIEQLDNKVREKKVDDIILKDEDYDLVNKIWSEEYSFRKSHKDTNGNLTKREPAVALEDKKKLLATLRDIDNGKSIEINEDVEKNVDRKKTRLIKELFG